jgi:hypothetical protein
VKPTYGDGYELEQRQAILGRLDSLKSALAQTRPAHGGVIPRYHGEVIQPDVNLKYPDLAYMRLSTSTLEIMGRNGYVQRFPIAWIRTGFGKHRALLVCSTCRGGAIRLFGRYGSYACRHWQRALYASQKNNQVSRKRLQASKLRLDLGGLPDINESFPPKPKWIRRRTYQSCVVKSKPSNSRRRHDASGSHYQHASLLITSDDGFWTLCRSSDSWGTNLATSRFLSNCIQISPSCTRVLNIIAVADLRPKNAPPKVPT